MVQSTNKAIFLMRFNEIKNVREINDSRPET